MKAQFRPADEPYHVTERLFEGRFFLPPDPKIICGVLTIIAKYCRLYRVDIVAWAINGNHLHIFLVDKDPEGPSQVWRVMQQSKSKMTSWLQSFWDWEPAVFTDMEQSESFPVLDCSKLIDTIAYIETNLEKDGLIGHASELPAGTVSMPWMRTTPLVVQTPDSWFREVTWGAETEITARAPDWLIGRFGFTRKRFNFKLDFEVFRRRQKLCRGRKRRPAGLKKLQANTPRKKGRKLTKGPKIKCAGGRSVCARFYLRERRFHRSYGRSISRVTDGKHETIFPYGTCVMVSMLGYDMARPP